MEGEDLLLRVCSLSSIQLIVIQGQISVVHLNKSRSNLGSAATLTSDQKIHGKLVPAG